MTTKSRLTRLEKDAGANAPILFMYNPNEETLTYSEALEKCEQRWPGRKIVKMYVNIKRSKSNDA